MGTNITRFLTFDWPVTLSFAKYILCIVPKGLNNSCKSDSLVSSDKFVTLIVADSSDGKYSCVMQETEHFGIESYELHILI